MYKQRLYQVLRFFVIVVSLVFIYFILQNTFSYIYPFVLAVILSLFLNPIVTFLEEKIKVPRVLATILVMIVALLLFIGLVIFIIAELVQGTTYLAEKIPAHFQTIVFIAEDLIDEHLLPLYHKLTSFFNTLSPGQQEAISENLKQILEQFRSFGTNFLQHILLQIPVALTLLPESFTVLIFIILGTFIITNDWHGLVESVKKIIPQSVHETGKAVWDHLKKAVFGFFKAQLVLILLTAITIFTGLVIFKVDHALTITIFAALVDVLPLLGTGIIFIPWILYLFLTGDYSMTISISILYMIVVIQRQLLEPKIVSSNIGLNPLAALIALFAGVQIWGVLGLFFGPMVLIFGNALYKAGVFHHIWYFIRGT
ncbi:sporulation integral membrane protein YtvI [Virgibacillus doumboii]|uniref:sporulation integral membrane protein YtvI n=1 Tax=Virgibacillus doumboii TaxID=2697503 RepID=UPI0013E0CC21|nr:sporulation integral membrane protein YtvI [Virgibacillus doumboii]